MPAFKMSYEWNFEQLYGYLGTWSAVKHYRKQNNTDPVQLIEPQLRKAWDGPQLRSFNFPVSVAGWAVALYLFCYCINSIFNLQHPTSFF
jgi:hypothetical protein